MSFNPAFELKQKYSSRKYFNPWQFDNCSKFLYVCNLKSEESERIICTLINGICRRIRKYVHRYVNCAFCYQVWQKHLLFFRLKTIYLQLKYYRKFFKSSAVSKISSCTVLAKRYCSSETRINIPTFSEYYVQMQQVCMQEKF